MSKDVRTIYLMLYGAPQTEVADNHNDMISAIELMNKYAHAKDTSERILDWFMWSAL